MASIVKRKHKHKTTYLCFIRRKGFKTLRKTFQTRQDAQKWSRYIERNLDSGISTDFSEASRVMIKDLLKRYLKEHKHKHKKGWRMEEYRVGYMLKDPIADVNLLQLSSKDIAEFRDRRLEVVLGTTFNTRTYLFLTLLSI